MHLLRHQTLATAARAHPSHSAAPPLFVKCRLFPRLPLAAAAMADGAGGGSGSGGGGDGKYRWQDTCLAGSGGGGGGGSAAQIAPAAENNKGPILATLVRERVLPEAPGAPGAPAARVLEIASGTGQHIAHFASALPHAAVTWQPSDLTPELFTSIAAHTRGLPNVAAPIVLDAAWPPERWAEALGLGHGGAAAEEKAAAAEAAGGPSDQHPPPAAACGDDALYDAVLAANLTHISPWPVTLGLLAGAARVLKPGGRLAIYGPFTLDGRFTTPSNLAFHERLVASDPAWGYRDTRDIAAEATKQGLALDKIEPMPANNFYLLFTKQ